MRTMSRPEGASVAIVHSMEAIESLLRRGLSPITDNRDALLALGFARSYPQGARGYQATIWERSVEHLRNSSGYRTLARQRAFLDGHRQK